MEPVQYFWLALALIFNPVTVFVFFGTLSWLNGRKQR